MDKFIREKSGTSQYQTEDESESKEEEEEEARSLEPEKKEGKLSQDDVLNLGDGGQMVEEHADKVRLAFYDGGPTNHQPSLPGGFSPEVLDDMYQQARQNSGNIAARSASSVAG
ncbi:unnamed protein product [Lactuca virosa]|uniref:Uncharacterized protein n=1 Tax=Lactuca virosa TaxID=75947 RepID=A0AAU9M2G2_9ASTR|nr:unnamed protein product [Lactuca virosa]